VAVLEVVGASLLTAALLRGQALGNEVTTRDRLLRDLDDDLAMWMRDRDRAARQRMEELRPQFFQGGAFQTGMQRQSRAKVYELVLYDYRDEALRIARDAHTVIDRDRLWHRFVRRGVPQGPWPTWWLRGKPHLPRLRSEGRAILAAWRENAANDPSRPEQRLAVLERDHE